jgi:hypothetical protein
MRAEIASVSRVLMIFHAWGAKLVVEKTAAPAPIKLVRSIALASRMVA